MASPAFKPWNPPKLTWFITGAASGFGLAIARIALANGHAVIATSRNPSGTDPSIKAELELLGARWVALELSDLNNASVIDGLEKEGVHIDVLFNCAGGCILGPAEAISEAELRHQMDMLFFGPYRLARAAVKYMRERRRGIIVNISSGSALEGRDSMSAYAASKAAMDRATHVLSKEVAPFNVRTLTVSLGSFQTNFASGITTPAAAPPADYKGSVAQATVDGLKGSVGASLEGDPVKACQAMYDVIVGQGIGEGREAEKFLPLGRDLAAAVKLATDRLHHSMDVFGEVCNNVYRDDVKSK